MPKADGPVPARIPRMMSSVADSRAPRRASVLGLLTTAAGVALLVWLIRRVGVETILAGFRQIGWGFGLVFVLGLDPPVSALVRRGWGRGKAALAVFAVILTVLFIIVVWAITPIWNAIEGFANNLPGYVEEETGAVTFDDSDDAVDYGVVDEIARRVWLGGGKVLAVRRDDIPGKGSVAAILRYAP